MFSRKQKLIVFIPRRSQLPKKKKKYVAQICQTKNLPKEIQTSEKGTSLRYIRPLNNSGARGATLLHN